MGVEDEVDVGPARQLDRAMVEEHLAAFNAGRIVCALCGKNRADRLFQFALKPQEATKLGMPLTHTTYANTASCRVCAALPDVMDRLDALLQAKLANPSAAHRYNIGDLETRHLFPQGSNPHRES